MMHKTRTFSINKLDSFDELADQLLNYSFVLCQGFQVGEYLFLNDSSSEDGAQEFAVIHNGFQVESLTVSWVKSKEEMLDLLAELPGELVLWDAKDLELDYSPDHSCYHCK